MADDTVSACDPASQPARAMGEALWDEVQRRYGFTAENPLDPEAFRGPVGGFWVASGPDGPVGSIALSPLEHPAAELDVMYVGPAARGTGLAQALLAVLEKHARSAGVTELRLRAGEPQPEALRFYAKAGFVPIASFGRWTDDPTARCFAMQL